MLLLLLRLPVNLGSCWYLLLKPLTVLCSVQDLRALLLFLPTPVRLNVSLIAQNSPHAPAPAVAQGARPGLVCNGRKRRRSSHYAGKGENNGTKQLFLFVFPRSKTSRASAGSAATAGTVIGEAQRTRSCFLLGRKKQLRLVTFLRSINPKFHLNAFF